MSRLTVGSIEGLVENSNVISVPTGHSLNVADAGGLQIGGSAVVSAGLVFISRTTIGSAVSSVTVSNAFSADYDTYKIIISGGAGSTNINLSVQMGSTTTGYYGGLIYQVYSTAAIAGVGQVNAANWTYAGQAGSLGLTMNATIMQPYLEKATSFMSLQPRLTPVSGAGTNSNYSGFLNDATSYTSFTVGTDTGTLTGGTIDVYGYSKS